MRNPFLLYSGLTLKRIVRCRVEFGMSALFFVLVVSLFAITLGNQARHITPLQGVAIIWVSTLLSTLLAAEKLYLADFTQGLLVYYLLSPIPLSVLLWVKMMAHWLATGLPVLILTPMVAIGLQFPLPLLPTLLFTLLLGTQILSALGSLAGLLTLGLPRAGLLLCVLLLPLYFPTLLLSMSVMENTYLGLPAFSSKAWLGVLWCVIQLSTPWLSAAILKICLRNG